MTLAERAAILLASLALSLGLIALLSGFFAGRDPGTLSGASAIPGTAYRDLGDGPLIPGELRAPYDSSPPTSGPHLPAAVTRDASTLSDDQLLTALAAGDVVIMYGTARPKPRLAKLLRNLAAPFTPALAAAGQAVILARKSSRRGLLALSWAHSLAVRNAGDPRLREFVGYWLGRGAPG